MQCAYVFTVSILCRSHDFYRILTEPENNMIKQQQALLETEGVEMQFTDAAIREISRVAEEVSLHAMSCMVEVCW